MAAIPAGRLASKLTRASGSDNAASVYRRRRRDHERAGRGVRRGGHAAGDATASDHDLARGRRHRRTVLPGHLAGLHRRRSAPRWRKLQSRPTASAASASTPPARWSCSIAAGEPLTVSASGDRAAQRHRLDGSPRHGRGAADQRNRRRGAALCRRLDLARDGDAEAAVAEASTCARASTPPGTSSIWPII